jgi:hypothetical protein
MAPRRIHVQAVIERSPPPPWVGELPFREPVEWWTGTLLSWRWTDRAAGLWIGLVRYQRDGLNYEHAVSGELIDVQPDPANVPNSLDTAPGVLPTLRAPSRISPVS